MSFVIPTGLCKPIYTVIRILKDLDNRAEVADNLISIMQMMKDDDTKVFENDSNDTLRIECKGEALLVTNNDASRSHSHMALRQRPSNVDYSGMQLAGSIRKHHESQKPNQDDVSVKKCRIAEEEDQVLSTASGTQPTQHVKEVAMPPSSQETDKQEDAEDIDDIEYVYDIIKAEICKYATKHNWTESLNFKKNITTEGFLQHCAIASAKFGRGYVQNILVLYEERLLLNKQGIDVMALDKSVSERTKTPIKTIRSWWTRGKRIWTFVGIFNLGHDNILDCAVPWTRVYNMKDDQFKTLCSKLTSWNRANKKSMTYCHLLTLFPNAWISGVVTSSAMKLTCRNHEDILSHITVITSEDASWINTNSPEASSIIFEQGILPIIPLDNSDDETSKENNTVKPPMSPAKDLRVRGQIGISFFQSDLIIMSWFVNKNHFVLVIIKNLAASLEKGTSVTIYVLDSIKPPTRTLEEAIERRIIDWLQFVITTAKLPWYEDVFHFKFIKVPQQEDGCSCGLFVMYFFEQLVESKTVFGGDIEGFMGSLTSPDKPAERRKWHQKLLNYLQSD